MVVTVKSWGNTSLINMVVYYGCNCEILMKHIPDQLFFFFFLLNQFCLSFRGALNERTNTNLYTARKNFPTKNVHLHSTKMQATSKHMNNDSGEHHHQTMQTKHTSAYSRVAATCHYSPFDHRGRGRLASGNGLPTARTTETAAPAARLPSSPCSIHIGWHSNRSRRKRWIGRGLELTAVDGWCDVMNAIADEGTTLSWGTAAGSWPGCSGLLGRKCCEHQHQTPAQQQKASSNNYSQGNTANISIIHQRSNRKQAATISPKEILWTSASNTSTVTKRKQ